ncbi:hypothetical protein [Rhodococcus sp. IEGM 1318]|nr:hypothetical protein [Rhodococcus sp. IEGM 1318]MDV8009060.1 hypothetical protein [Rhodococcus sp. IEGM 1318]
MSNTYQTGRFAGSPGTYCFNYLGSVGKTTLLPALDAVTPEQSTLFDDQQ